MSVFSKSGAKVFTSVPAMLALVICLDWISPAILCEKNSIGIRSTFHIYAVLPMTDILPFIFRLYTVCANATTIFSSAIPDITPINGMSHSLFCPVRSMSIKILDMIGLIMPNSELMTVVSITNAAAAAAGLVPLLSSFVQIYISAYNTIITYCLLDCHCQAGKVDIL